jgi:hypothetical protein
MLSPGLDLCEDTHTRNDENHSLVAGVEQVCVAHHPADVFRQLHLARPTPRTPATPLAAQHQECE